MEIIALFACKHKFMSQLRGNTFNYAKLVRIDQLQKFSNDELVLEELLKSKVADDALKLKAVFNL